MPGGGKKRRPRNSFVMSTLKEGPRSPVFKEGPRSPVFKVPLKNPLPVFKERRASAAPGIPLL